MIELLCVRHGESSSMAASRVAGVLADEDNGLTASGRAQSEALGRLLSARTGTRYQLIASPLRRARETADILLGHLGLAECTVDPRLCERRFDFPRGTSNETSQRLQLEAALRPELLPPFGEAIGEHRARVRAWFDDFVAVAEEGATYVVVSHGGTTEHLQSCLLGRPLSALGTSFTACGPAHYHHWTRLEPLRGHFVWRLDGIDLRAESAVEGDPP
jgi:broad specificity phosphatase PhoE